MGRVKDLWIAKEEEVIDDYINRKINRQDAINTLIRELGMDHDWATDVIELVSEANNVN